MPKFIPGKILKEFKTRSGKRGVLRYPKWEDLDSFTKYINEVSKEDLYVSFSGEQLSKREEAMWVANLFVGMEMRERAQVLCVVDGELAGAGTLGINTAMLKRSRHVASIGIMIRKKYRGDGVGMAIMKELIEQARTFLKGVRLIELCVFAKNKTAIKLYKELGFKEVGRIPKSLKHKGKYQDELTMVLELVR